MCLSVLFEQLSRKHEDVEKPKLVSAFPTADVTGVQISSCKEKKSLVMACRLEPFRGVLKLCAIYLRFTHLMLGLRSCRRAVAQYVGSGSAFFPDTLFAGGGNIGSVLLVGAG